jgi:hypothetical protein
VGAQVCFGGIEGDILRSYYGYGHMLIGRELEIMYEQSPGEVKECRGFLVHLENIFGDYTRLWRFRAGIAVTEISVIREPLKLRPITKGTPSLYGILKPYQKLEWELLQNTNCFTLTGKESEAGVWTAQLNKPLPGDDQLFDMATHRRPKNNCWWVSGDFKQSTNDVHMDATTTATQALWDPSDWPLINKGLGAQVIRPQGPERCWPAGAEEIVQSHGQLMGSPLSFPILCIINAAIGRRAFELAYKKRFSLNACPMLINGDDFVARGSPEFYRIWSWLISEVGWEESVGKSFFSHEFAQMNSQTRRPTWVSHHDGTAFCFFGDAIAYFNYGYASGMKKTISECNETPVEDCAISLREQWAENAAIPKPLIRRGKEVFLDFLRHLGDKMAEISCLPCAMSVYNGVEWGGFGLVDGVGDSETASKFLLLSPVVEKPQLWDEIGEFESSADLELFATRDPRDLTSRLRQRRGFAKLRLKEIYTLLEDGGLSKDEMLRLRKEKLSLMADKNLVVRSTYERRLSTLLKEKAASRSCSKAYFLGRENQEPVETSYVMDPKPIVEKSLVEYDLAKSCISALERDLEYLFWTCKGREGFSSLQIPSSLPNLLQVAS